MYQAIEDNFRYSLILIVLFIFFFSLGSYFLIVVWLKKDPYYLALVVSFASLVALFSYLFGDRLVLASIKPIKIFPGEMPKLEKVVEEMALASGMPQPTLYRLPTRALNSFVVGRSPETASLVVTTGIVENLSREELRGVIAHEFAHIKSYDITYNTLICALLGSSVLLKQIIKNSISGESLLGEETLERQIQFYWASLWLIIFFAPLFLFFFGGRLIQLLFSRYREYLADAFAVQISRYPEGLMKALLKMGKQLTYIPEATSATSHLFIMPPEGIRNVPVFFQTHPSLVSRVERLRYIVSPPIEVKG